MVGLPVNVILDRAVKFCLGLGRGEFKLCQSTAIKRALSAIREIPAETEIFGTIASVLDHALPIPFYVRQSLALRFLRVDRTAIMSGEGKKTFVFFL